MSATATQSAGAFVESLTTSPSLQETAREQGLTTAAEEAGFDLTPEEIQAALKGAVREDLPDHDVDEKERQAGCTFTMCSCNDVIAP